MREILFRGKRVNTGEWIEGYYVHSPEGEGTYDNEQHFIQVIPRHGGLGAGYEVIPETVGQFTGLLDKNGKKIFEGDIVRCEIEYDVGCYPHTETYTGTVMYEGGMFHPLCIHCDTKKVEVLGNSWDDPDWEDK